MTEKFKTVEWMRQVRARIDAEDEGLEWTDKHRRTLEILDSDPLWRKLRSRVADTRMKTQEIR